MTTPKTDPRPMTPAEARALDALVEWRKLDDVAVDLPIGSRAYNAKVNAMISIEDVMYEAADAVVAEREVRNGA